MLTLQEQQSNDSFQSESTSESGVNSVNDYEIEVSPTKNRKKRHLSSKLQSKRYPKRLALWFTRRQFEELVSKLHTKYKMTNVIITILYLVIHLIYIHLIHFQNIFQDIEKEIEKHLKGDAVLIYYKNNGILNGEARGVLVDILASCMIKINIK